MRVGDGAATLAAAMPRLAVPLALLTLLLGIAGCGGQSGPGTGGGSAETEAGTLVQAGDDAEAPGLKNDPIYIEAGNICINLPIEQLAAQYGVEATPEAVSKAVAEDYPEADRKKAEQGCRDVLETGKR